MEKNLGHATAYGYAKSKGYSGTEDEFAELMADYASVGQSAAQSAEQAAASATSASGSATTASQAAQTATSKASEAVTAASTATTKASEASTSADTASAAALSAGTSAQTATTAATTATTKASEAAVSANTATTAKTDAEKARDAAVQSASEAAASAESIDPETLEHKAYGAYVVESASGAIASFADGADNIPMKDVLVHIEPVQAGSGDPSPENVRPITGWTGANISRAGKNLCINTNFVAGEVDGITYIMNDDGSINCNGTSTGTANKWLLNNNSRYILPSGNYILSGGANVSSRGMRIVLSINRISGTIDYINAASSADVPFAINDGDTIRGIYLRISESTVLVSNVTIYPMIRPAAFTDNTYEPYAAPAIYNVSFPTEAGTVYGGTLDVTKGELVVDRAIIASYAGETLPSTWISDRDVYSEGATPTTGAQVCYYLAAPITYQLTPQEITSLLGTNNLWADTGDSDVTYCVDPTLLLDIARQGETVNIPYTEHKGYFEASGNIANQTSSKEYYTEKIDIALFKSIGASVEYPAEQSLWLACATYDENGDFIERVVFANLTNIRAYGQTINVNNDVRYIAFTYRKFDNGILKIFGSLSESGVAAKIISHSATKASLADGFQFRFKPCYDHLFVGKSAGNTVIPHESLYHVRISKALGFDIIEANIASTSDGVYIVNHLNDRKFGRYFHHADGQTDISDIAVSSVTWDWICQNVRYNSTLKKYQTRPSRVEEFLSECRQQNIIPFIYSADPAVLEIADSYMGKNNYIAYGAEREKCPTAIIYHWVTKTSKEEIIEYCEQVGKPLIYGMSNPTAFTDAELREIIDALHTRGFWIGCSYADYEWHKYSAMGFDLNGTQLAINRMQCGNLYNFDTLLSFDDFNVTGASEVDGELVFSANGTIEPDINDTILGLGAVDIEISFSGTITMHGIGERTVAYTYTSDGTLPFFVATPIIGGSPKFTADVTSGTIVKDIKYKASKL